MQEKLTGSSIPHVTMLKYVATKGLEDKNLAYNRGSGIKTPGILKKERGFSARMLGLKGCQEKSIGGTTIGIL